MVKARKYGFAVAALSKILEYSKSHLLNVAFSMISVIRTVA